MKKNLLFLFFISCSINSNLLKAQNKWSGKTIQEMLANIAQNTKPSDAFFLNTERAKAIDLKLSKATSLQEQLSLKVQLAYELLQAGETKSTVKLLANVIMTADSLRIPVQKDIYDLLGIAYLRYGEQENCCAKHTGESCIIPISPKAQHTKPRGSELALNAFNKVLETNPTDYQTMWLLNIAYMTLGKYPQDVPPQYLILFKDDEVIDANKKFKDIAPERGIDAIGLSGGSILDDFNNDGHLDIICSSYGLKDPLTFYINNGNGTFTDATKNSGLHGELGGLNIVQTDYNNDGYLDILVLRGGWWDAVGEIPNSLLRNNKNGTFTNVTIEAGLLSFSPTQTASWADVNLDGYLDLFIGNESKIGGKQYPCEMHLNNGNGTFTNVAKTAGLNFNGYVKGAVFGDINLDGLPDLYVSILGEKNKLFLNKGGNKQDFKMEDISQKAGTGEPINSFPCAMLDFNNDGLQDIFVSGYSVDRLNKVAEDMALELLQKPLTANTPRLYLNKGNNAFEDYTQASGFDKKICYTMGMNIGDIDNDGWQDLYLGTGAPDYSTIVPNRMFKNAEGKKIKEITYSGGFGQLQKGHGMSFGDVDNDGDQDIYVVLGGAIEGDTYQNELFINPATNTNWLTLKLIGSEGCNTAAIGSSVHITAINADGSEKNIYQEVNSGGSFGANSLQQEVGLGEAKSIKKIEIQWMDKARSKSIFTDVKPNTKYLIQGKKIEMLP